MKKTTLGSLVIIGVLTFATSPMAMKVEPVISYQGILTDSDGVPLNGTYDMRFTFTDESGATLWEEFHAGVEVGEGFFTVVLGETDPIPPDAFVSESDEGDYAIRNLEIQIREDPPLTPTTRLLTAPYSVASHRVAGDIFTSPGSIRMGVEPQPFIPSVEIQALSDDSHLTFFDPLVDNDDKTVSRMSVGTGGQFSWNLFLPDISPPKPVMDMNSGTDGDLNWTFFYPEALDPDEPASRTHSWGDPDGIFGGADIQLFGSPPFTSASPVISICAYEGFGDIAIANTLSGSYASYMPHNMSFFDGELYTATAMISGNEGCYLLNSLGLGTAYTGNILTVAPSSETDPIADAWTVYSSRRWEKNIKPIGNALEKIELLRGVSFDWKADGKHDIGLIAEEVGEIIPEVVAYEENGVDAKSVDYARLVAVLIEAVKEQQKTITGLEKKIDALSRRFGQLTERRDEESNDVSAVELAHVDR